MRPPLGLGVRNPGVPAGGGCAAGGGRAGGGRAGGGRAGGGRAGGGRAGGRAGGGRAGGRAGGGPPSEVIEFCEFIHVCEGDVVAKLTIMKIPRVNAPVYLPNKTQIGIVDEIFGAINESYLSVKMNEGIVATYAPGDKFCIDPAMLLPFERFLPQANGRGGRRGGGRGFGERGGGGGGGFLGRGAPRGGVFRGGPRGGPGGFRGGRGR